ncbi:Lactation elevated protein 1 [Hordeum vulgare]|nr:Lactation elevated protein 1 [Hordeum vulgare]
MAAARSVRLPPEKKGKVSGVKRKKVPRKGRRLHPLPLPQQQPNEDKKSREKIKREHEASRFRDKINAMVQSNELMLAKTLKAKKESGDKKAREKQEKWQSLEDEGLRKAAIEERRVFADETKAMDKLLVEENKIMALNRDDMDDIAKEWHDMARRNIFKRRMVAAAGG